MHDYYSRETVLLLSAINHFAYKTIQSKPSTDGYTLSSTNCRNNGRSNHQHWDLNYLSDEILMLTITQIHNISYVRIIFSCLRKIFHKSHVTTEKCRSQDCMIHYFIIYYLSLQKLKLNQNSRQTGTQISRKS